MPFKNHLKSYIDLITTHEETRAGFIAQALEKNFQATPFIDEAKALKVFANKAKAPNDLIQMTEIQTALITAAGISAKALSHILEEDKIKAISEFIKNFLEPAGRKFVDELVYRFLLTKGDALGGMMRNIVGKIGERKLIRTMISVLKIFDYPYFWFDGRIWLSHSDNDIDIDKRLKGLYWNNSKDRTLIFNIKVPAVSKNVDLCLFDCHFDVYNNSSIKELHRLYLALGEVKGGIDPAGADEHWKTANSALIRIRNAFNLKKMKTKTFFIGASIEKSMAEEIFKQLNSKILTNAANLTNDNQVIEICKWLIEL